MTYRVFISSTYLDNRDRRKEVREAVERAGMTPVGMERFTADERPTVNVCQGLAVECELFVGIVAHRYGWEPEGQPPGEGKSITWLEYEAARAAGRPCLMFQIDPAAKFGMEDLDPAPDTWTKRGKLERFRAVYAQDQMPAFFEDGKLGMSVMQALVEWRERQEKKGIGAPEIATVPASLDVDLRRYREEALKAHRDLPLGGFEKTILVPISLEEIYIPLQAVSDLRGHGEPPRDAEHAREAMGERESSLLDAFRLATSVGREGLVILGEPGSGKTTHLKRLLLYCLREGPEKLGLPAGMMPVFLPLHGLEDPDREAVDRFIERHINEQLGLSNDFGRRLLDRGNLLLLFDGLDEVADPARRQKVSKWVGRVRTAHSSCRLVVTCRFAGYTDEVRLGSSFLEMSIQALRGEQIERFVSTWYRLVEAGLNPDREAALRQAEKRTGELLAQLKTPDLRTAKVAEMLGNPLLLANLCQVHRNQKGRLPEDRRQLYDACVDLLLERWRARPGALGKVRVEQAKRALQPVAEWLHEEKGRRRASGAELEKVLKPVLKVMRWEAGGAKGFLDLVRDESGLLTGWGQDQFGFMHLGFQEYLAASELRRRASEAGEGQGAVLGELARRYGEDWWQEVLLLFVAMGNPSLFKPLMREVVKLPAFAEKRELLGMLLEEAAEKDASPFVELLRQEPGLDAGLWWRQRAALEALQRLGAKDELEKLAAALRRHPSPEIQEWARGASGAAASGVEVTEKGGELVHIEGGEFLMGSPPDEEGRWEWEQPPHPVKVASFWLGRYPVTNEQYGRFLKENPHIEQPKFWSDRRFNQPRQPVVGVTWDEARTFAEWAGGRLPTEAEWEYACRAGTKGPRYEEDLDAIAWYAGNSGGTTQPVGQKRPNAWGLHDMLGNVWEWCGDVEAGSDRVLRGGSWFSYARGVRAADRVAIVPGDGWSDLGLRLARGQVSQDKQGGAQGAAERP